MESILPCNDGILDGGIRCHYAAQVKFFKKIAEDLRVEAMSRYKYEKEVNEAFRKVRHLHDRMIKMQETIECQVEKIEELESDKENNFNSMVKETYKNEFTKKIATERRARMKLLNIIKRLKQPEFRLP